MDAKGRLYALSETDSLLARFDKPATADSPDRMIPVGGARSHYFVVKGNGSRAYVAGRDRTGGDQLPRGDCSVPRVDAAVLGALLPVRRRRWK